MGTVHIPTLLEGILEATAAEAAAKARIATLRATLEDEGRRRLAAEGAAPSWNTPQLGKVRLDPPGAWEATVEDDAAFGSYVAERYPTEATVAIHVNAADAEDALAALTFIGVDPVVPPRVEVRSAWLGPFLKRLDLDVTEETDESAQVRRTVVALDPDSEPGTSAVVPGIGAGRSAAKLVVTLDRDRRTAAITEARKTATALVEAASDDAEEAAVDLAALDVARRNLEVLHSETLATIAKAHGLGASGTKAELAERIARAEQASGNVIRPATSIGEPPTADQGRIVEGLHGHPYGSEEAATVSPLPGLASIDDDTDGVAYVDTSSPLPEGTEVEEVSTVPTEQPVEEAPADCLAENLDTLSREVLRQHAKAIGVSAAGTKGDVIDRLVEAKVTISAVNETARRSRA